MLMLFLILFRYFCAHRSTAHVRSRGHPMSFMLKVYCVPDTALISLLPLHWYNYYAKKTSSFQESKIKKGLCLKEMKLKTATGPSHGTCALIHSTQGTASWYGSRKTTDSTWQIKMQIVNCWKMERNIGAPAFIVKAPICPLGFFKRSGKCEQGRKAWRKWTDYHTISIHPKAVLTEAAEADIL